MHLLVPKSIQRRLKRHMFFAGRREIGGILMGEMVGDQRFRIADISVDTVSGSLAHFVRDAEHHERELRAFFERTGADYKRFNYLGEWHSHPSFEVTPSGPDIRAMRNLVEGTRGVDFAVLFINRLKRVWQMEASATLFVRGYGGCHAQVEFE